MLKKMKDIPQKICVFGDIVLVLYLSGLILKFSVTVSTSRLDPRSKVVTFRLRHRFECLLGMSPLDADHIQLSHGPVTDKKNYPDGCTRVYCKLFPQEKVDDDDEEEDGDEEYSEDDEDEEEAGVWVLEDDNRLIAIDGVDQLCDIRRIGDDDYCLISRNYDAHNEYDLDLNDLRDTVLFPTRYLELWKNDDCVRTLKVKGLEDAKMNGFCVVLVSFSGIFQPACMVRFNLLDFENRSVRSMDLVPVSVMNIDKIPTFLYLTQTQIMWSVHFEGFKNEDGHTEGDGDEFHCINSFNFWYAPYERDYAAKYPTGLVMATMIG